jgi:hypothetical protein
MNTYAQIAQTLEALKNCQKSGNRAWEDRHQDKLDELCKRLPHGSGFDCGTKLDIDESTSKKLVFITSFHHMDGNGFYSGWTEHKVIITPEFAGYSVRVTGKNKGGIKDYIMDVFSEVD